MFMFVSFHLISLLPSFLPSVLPFCLSLFCFDACLFFFAVCLCFLMHVYFFFDASPFGVHTMHPDRWNATNATKLYELQNQNAIPP